MQGDKKCTRINSPASKETVMWCRLAFRVSADAVIRGSGRDGRGTLASRENEEKEVDSIKSFFCYAQKASATISDHPLCTEEQLLSPSTAQSSHGLFSYTELAFFSAGIMKGALPVPQPISPLCSPLTFSPASRSPNTYLRAERMKRADSRNVGG